MSLTSNLASLGFGAGLTTLLAVSAASAAEPDPHAHHHMMMAAAPTSIQRSLAEYPLADQKLVRQDGKATALLAELNDGRPVYLNFIYTTCTTICPLSSQVFSLLQQKLGDDRNRVHLMSVSIDPEQDTPARLAAYAERYHAGAGWTHYTSTLEASVAVQRAFNAYRGDKMNHTPLTLYRAAPGQSWVRLDGFATADQLLAEFRPIVARGP
jgi:protein SCO1/2